MERKWTDRQYHVQDNADVSHQDVIIFCNTNKSPELSFCGPHSKPHGARGLSKHYHLRFHPKPGMGVRKMIIMGIDLCDNTFSHIGVQHQHYPEHDTVCISILFP